MRHRTSYATPAILATLMLMGAGCVHPHHHPQNSSPRVVRNHESGPPAHAPAHGYRKAHRSHGVELVFDVALGTYIVVGYPHHYFHGNRFYKRMGGDWYVSVNFRSGWAIARVEGLPVELRKISKHAGKKSHERHKRGHPAKHGR